MLGCVSVCLGMFCCVCKCFLCVCVCVCEALGVLQWAMACEQIRGWVPSRDTTGCGDFKWRCVRTGDLSDSPPPLVQDPWVVHFDAISGSFYCEDSTTGECVDEQPIPVPDGLVCGFDASLDMWCFRHVATSELFFD